MPARRRANILSRVTKIGKDDQGNTKGENEMRHRTRTVKSIDRRIFARTARKTKKMNVEPKILRGGIKL